MPETADAETGPAVSPVSEGVAATPPAGHAGAAATPPAAGAAATPPAAGEPATPPAGHAGEPATPPAADGDALRRQQGEIDLLFKRIDDAYDRAARAAGLSPSAFDILYALHQAEGITQKEICDMSYTGKQTINASIHKMERDGLIRFEGGGGRRRLIYLTDRGRRLAEAAIAPVVAAEDAALGEFAAEERRKMLAALRRYAEALVGRLDRIAAAKER